MGQIELVHQALDGEVHLAALLATGDAVGHPDDIDAVEAEAMVKAKQSPVSRVRRDRSSTRIVSKLGRCSTPKPESAGSALASDVPEL